MAVSQWTTSDMELVVENDIQLDGLRVWEETGRQLYPMDWVRGGFNLSSVAQCTSRILNSCRRRELSSG